MALLREAEHRFRVIRKLSECFTDHRDPRYTTHCLLSIVAQRVLAICCGYEDIVDHDRFRTDPMAGMFCGTSCALAGKSTLNRMELGGSEAERYKKIVGDFGAMDTLCVELFMRFHGKAPTKIVLDIDVTDDPVHGNQEGRFYHGYYTKYCYAPSYIFCGRHLLGCRLRKANQDSAAGAVEEFERIEKKIEEYHRALEEADAADEKAGKQDVGNDEVLREKIEKLKRRQEEKRELKSRMERSGDTQVSTVDEDARLLKKPGQSVAGYNAQIAVDSKHKLVVAEHVVQNSTDHHQLAGMLTEAKERLEVKRLTGLADGGYYESTQLKRCEDEDITVYVPVPDTGAGIRNRGRYAVDEFDYDAGGGLLPVSKGEAVDSLQRDHTTKREEIRFVYEQEH